jgi:hypothetical protein
VRAWSLVQISLGLKRDARGRERECRGMRRGANQATRQPDSYMWNQVFDYACRESGGLAGFLPVTQIQPFVRSSNT